MAVVGQEEPEIQTAMGRESVPEASASYKRELKFCRREPGKV